MTQTYVPCAYCGALAKVEVCSPPECTELIVRCNTCEDWDLYRPPTEASNETFAVTDVWG